MTNDQMTKLVMAELGLQDIAAYDETAFVATWIYNGTLDLLARTRCVARCVHLNVTAGVDQYTLDHSILSLVDVEDGARPRANRADDQRNNSFVLVRSDVLLVQPTPSEIGTLDVWAVMRPQKMVLPTDSPADEAYGAIPEEWHDAILTYAFWHGSSYSDDASSQQGERYRMQYEGQDGRGGRLAQIRAAVNKRGTARAARMRVDLRTPRAKASWVG